jgi:formylglycine-generating enzyme required for sulfatase activity
MVTDQEGKASFKFTSSQPGVRMITASVGEVKLDATVAVIFSGGAVETIPVTAGIDPNRIKWEKDGAEMVLIPAGTFEMGDSKNEPESMGGALPLHSVTLNGFYMDATEVTNGQYAVFIEQMGHRKPSYWTDNRYNQANQPVVGKDCRQKRNGSTRPVEG